MRRIILSFAGAFVVAFTFADAYICTYNGSSLAGIPLTKPPLWIDETVPSNPNLNDMRFWQFSLCTQTPYSGCTVPASYVVEINREQDACFFGFDNALSDAWTYNYGGANALFGGTYVSPNDRIANVTLLCDPSATTLQPVGTVTVYPSQDGAVWTYDIVLNSNAVCHGPLPPPPPPPSPSPPPPPPTFWTSAAPFTAPPPAASYNCSFAGGIITNEVSLLSILVVDPGSEIPSQYYNWSFSFCKLTNDAICSWPNSYISMVQTAWQSCYAAFDVPLSTQWGIDYGGANALFGAQVGNSTGLIANVTIVCDPAATTLAAVGPVVFNTAPGGDVNFYNIRLASSLVCGSTLPPAPPHRQGAITIKAYPALDCEGRGVTSEITPGCAANGPSGSVFSACTNNGSALQQFYFPNSTMCAGAWTLTETTVVNHCVNSRILEGQSSQLLLCTASEI